MFVGPPGVRKTTTIKFGSEVILSKLGMDGVIQSGPDIFTKEAIIERMQSVHDNSMYFVVGEFSDIFQKSGKDRDAMYEFFTSMYDGKETFVSATKASGNFNLERPCLNFFTATTPGWVGKHMPEEVITGGFASRVIFVYEEKPRIYKSFFDDVEGDFAGLEQKLAEDLAYIAKEISGEFTFTKEARDFAADWSATPPDPVLLSNEKLGGYLNRKFTQVAKLAQIHSLATKNELIIEKVDWEFGIHAIETTEAGRIQLFGSVGKNRYAEEVKRIVAFVRATNFFTNAPVPKHIILANFMHSAEPRLLNDLIRVAADSKLLKAVPDWSSGECLEAYVHPEFGR